jgi:hypothetical protein
MEKKCIDCVYLTRTDDGLMGCSNASRRYLWHLEKPYCTGWKRNDQKDEQAFEPANGAFCR